MINKPPLTTRLSSKDIDDLVVNYRSGSIGAAERLLEAFRPLIGKYLNLFFYGTYDNNDYDIKKFLYSCGKRDIHKTAEIIRIKLRKFDAEELVHVCKVALLETAKDHTNISGSYKFILRKHIENMLKDDFPDGMPDVELSEEDLLGHHIKKNIEINDDWIKGVTTGNGFCELSEEQRLIVKMVWSDKVPAIHICKALNLSALSLERKKEEIKHILSRSLNIKPLNRV